MQPSSLPWTTLIPLLLSLVTLAGAAVTQLDNSNLEQVLKGSEVVFVNFYADWCRFSQHLKPIFLEASEKFKDVPANKVIWASVDADRQPEISTKYHVNKYPTLKLFRNGELAKKEYRSQRSVEALAEFVQKQLDSSINVFANDQQLIEKTEKGKRNVIATFPAPAGIEYENYKKVASALREECVFHQGPAPLNTPISIKFKPANSDELLPYTQDLANFEQLNAWLTDKCIPLVREITFENAEELTEEGLPFLILFKLPDDKETEKSFTEAVIREIPDQKTAVNCLVADGRKFAHPLHHLGKGEKDLPLIAIDSFRHMYLFPNMQDMNTPGKLRQFIMDLHSGKLHREFHQGPDHPVVVVQVDPNRPPETQPPPSVFDKLKPSHNRYTILGKDEL